MITYKIVEKNNDIYKYVYYPYGKDIKVEGGYININIKTKEYKIISIASLDEKEDISEKELQQIIEHINILRKEQGYELIDIKNFDDRILRYKFLSSFISEVLRQIDSSDIQEKGIVVTK